jgi:hypothetical protein
MGCPLHFWLLKASGNQFENTLDTIRELINDVGARDYHLKGIEITSAGGANAIHADLTSGLAGKFMGIYLGADTDTLSPPFAPRPSIGNMLHFRDYVLAGKSMANPLPQESLLELTARLSHKIGPIMLLHSNDEYRDCYLGFENGDVSAFGIKYGEEFIIRYYGGEFKIDIYKPPPNMQSLQVGEERIAEAATKSGMTPNKIEIHEEELIQPFWHLALEGINIFYGTKLETIGTWETNLGTLADISDPGVGLYDIYPEGVSYSYPQKPSEEQKKPWWKVW